MQSELPVQYEVKDRVAVITMNDSERLNPLSNEMCEGLRRAFTSANEDPDVRVVIITGNGRAFSAGADLKEFHKNRLGPVPFDRVPMPGRNIRLDKPLIAAVNGFAYGGGFLYAMLADMVVASTDARFAVPEVKVGRGTPWAVPLIHMIPRKIWYELAVTAESISAERAYEIGFVNHVTSPKDLLPKAHELAGKIIAGAPLTVEVTSQMIRIAGEMGTTAAWDVADELFTKVYDSEDGVEGPRAFSEGRTPNWTGYRRDSRIHARPSF